MLNRIAWVGLGGVLVLAPLCAFAQTSQSAPAASNRTRAQHRNTLNRQKATATAEHARQLRAAPNK